jgi:type IV pilus assembly protein PilX
MNEKAWLSNEEGSVLILALIMLVLLTMIGISATTTSMIETRIAGNERVYKRNFYAAEAAVMQGAQNMEQTDLQNPRPTWLGLKGAVNEPDDIRLTLFWDTSLDPLPQASVIPNTLFVATSRGYAGGAQGTSLAMDISKVHTYSVFGRCQPSNSGPTIIEIGYRKAF